MRTGKVKKFFDGKGFGFITPDDGSDDLFAHKMKFNGNEDDIREGARVEYDAGMDDRSGKMRANSWSIQGGGSSGGGRRGGPMGEPGGGKTGVVKRYFEDKAFGFITMDDGSGDIFASARTFKGDERDIREGLKVSVETGMDDRSGKLRATTWSEVREGGMPPHGGVMPPHGGYGAMPMPHPGADPRCSRYGAMPHPAYGAPHPGYGMPPLPPGWEQFMDPASGRPYFCNRATGQTSWTPPGGPAPGPAPISAAAPSTGGVPPGWEQITDPASGKPYFCNKSTGEKRWDPPPGGSAPAPAPAAVPSAGGLPPVWEQIADPTSGKPYFCNRSAGETRWDPPPGGSAPAPAPAAAPSAGGLPPGWEQSTGPGSGKPYFCNRSTGKAGRSLTISGAQGTNAGHINGAYELDDAPHDGKPQWRKVGDANTWLAYVSKDNTWNVIPTDRRNAGNGIGFMVSLTKNAAMPTNVGEWNVWDGCWIRQSTVYIIENQGKKNVEKNDEREKLAKKDDVRLKKTAEAVEAREAAMAARANSWPDEAVIRSNVRDILSTSLEVLQKQLGSTNVEPLREQLRIRLGLQRGDLREKSKEVDSIIISVAKEAVAGCRKKRKAEENTDADKIRERMLRCTQRFNKELEHINQVDVDDVVDLEGNFEERMIEEIRKVRTQLDILSRSDLPPEEIRKVQTQLDTLSRSVLK